MQIIRETINCRQLLQHKNSKRVNPFNLVKCTFDYTHTDDKRILDTVIQKGKAMSIHVNKGAANDASYARNANRLVNNCVAGMLAEYTWKSVLNEVSEVVKETPFSSANNQIDLQIIKNNKTIEVRSSFPRNGIEFAICHSNCEFDIIGPYANSYKRGEIQKDFYVRTLFPFQSRLLLDNIRKTPFNVYLTGGATWEMMINDAYSKAKDFIPEDEMNLSRLTTKTHYRVVPFSNALDTNEMYNVITN